MNKKLIVILLFAVCVNLGAQEYHKVKTLEAENQRLQRIVDSLSKVNAELSGKNHSTAKGGRTIPGAEVLNGQYSSEKSDSMLCLWYENRVSADFDAVHEYNMDSVIFSSNVPDSVMIKRLKAMNSFITLPFNSTVKNYMIMYSEKMRRSMGRVLGLGKYYFPIFEATFAKYGLPHELEYMAIVESMLVPTATSRAGAKGIWQFMYRTGIDYGLQINSFTDERMDIEKSVDAAARYLRDSYMVFGDWSLAISSYNCGVGNVRKAISRAGGKSDFWSIYPYLPAETRGYVPAFVGAMYAVRYAKEYGIAPRDVGMPAQVDTFHIHKRLYFKQINEVVGIPVDDLRNMNPQYFRDVVPGTETKAAILKIPYNWTNAFMSFSVDSLANYKREQFAAEVNKGADEIPKVTSSSSSKSKGKTSSARYTVYTVRQGDTLSGIAKKYRGATVQSIMKYNGLKSTKLRVGQKLKIPRK